MTTYQGGPGNEPKEPDRTMLIQQTLNANIATGGSLLMAVQRCMEFVIWPERLKANTPDAGARLKVLVEDLLREIKNATADGFPESDEAAGKKTAIAFIEQIAVGLHNEIRGH